MHNRSTRSYAGRATLTLLLTGLVLLVGTGRAAATPWGAFGADYNGVLCRLGTTDVPMGAWTVNGAVAAFSTEDINGAGALQQPAPLGGAPATMTPGTAGFSQADIGAVAYLLAQHQAGSPAELAELSADVALVAGSGTTQSRCLGQNGTDARRATDRLDDARRFAGPYQVQVATRSGVIPGGAADVAVTVRSATGAATPGLQVSLAAGDASASGVTGRDGVARTTIAIPAAATVPVVATVAVPTGLVYLATSPPSVALGPLTTVSGTGTLRPVLHPTPAVSVAPTDLVLAGGTVRPVVTVTGTFGYSGTGEVSLRGPIRTPGACAAASVDGATVRWQDTFTFRGDAQYRALPTPTLEPGCYGLRATVTTTNSSPPERAGSPAVPLTVATLQLTSTATATAAPPGGLAATVVGAAPGRARVTTTVQARGPLPVGKGRCTGDFGNAPLAGSSAATPLRPAGGRLGAVVRIPDVRTPGCYALLARSEITLDGTSTTTDARAAATTAILRPGIVVAADAVSGQQGKGMPGTVQVSGTFGFPGVVAVGVIEGATIPITGCRDATFARTSAPTITTPVPTVADTSYAFRTPAPTRNACYSVEATFTLTGNPAVTATSGAPNETSAFLAGVGPDTGTRSVVQSAKPQGFTRAALTIAITTLVMLAGCVALFVQTFRHERGDGEPGRLPAQLRLSGYSVRSVSRSGPNAPKQST